MQTSLACSKRLATYYIIIDAALFVVYFLPKQTAWRKCNSNIVDSCHEIRQYRNFHASLERNYSHSRISLSDSGSGHRQRPVNARVHGTFAQWRRDGDWLATAALGYHSQRQTP